MKKYLILFLISFTLGCQKDKNTPTPVNPPPDPGPDPIGETYNITVTLGDHGNISPKNTTLKLGDNVSYTITPDAGYNIQQITVDDSLKAIDSITSGSFTYNFNKVNANHKISVTFTDSLSFSQIDSMNTLLIGKWYTKKYEYKISDTIFHDPWHSYVTDPCIEDFDVYDKNHNYENHNVAICSGNKDEIMDSGIWSFSPNGKSYSVKEKDGSTHFASVVKITKDSLITTFVVEEKHIMWKAYSTH